MCIRDRWLPENNDGSQVICLCQVEKENNMQNNDDDNDDDEIPTTTDVGTQTPPLKRSSPPIPNAPKRVQKMLNIPIDEEYDGILKQKIFATHPDLYNDKEFKEKIENNNMRIEDKTKKGEVYIEVNKRLSNDFTYKDLKYEILQASLDVSKGRRMRFNIRFISTSLHLS